MVVCGNGAAPVSADFPVCGQLAERRRKLKRRCDACAKFLPGFDFFPDCFGPNKWSSLTILFTARD